MPRPAIPRIAAAATLTFLALGGCATATTYHPASGAKAWAEGYHDLTTAAGYDWFLAVSRDTETHADLVVRDALGGWSPDGSPRWRITRPGADR